MRHYVCMDLTADLPYSLWWASDRTFNCFSISNSSLNIHAVQQRHVRVDRPITSDLYR